MDENLTKDSDVARDRLTLDITDLKERIEEVSVLDPDEIGLFMISSS